MKKYFVSITLGAYVDVPEDIVFDASTVSVYEVENEKGDPVFTVELSDGSELNFVGEHQSIDDIFIDEAWT